MRTATSSDIDAIVQTISADMSKGHFEIIPAMEFRKLVEDCIKGEMSDGRGRTFQTWVYIYEVDGRFVGCAVVREIPKTRFESRYPDNTRELWMLSITSEARGSGHGKRFTHELIQQYPDNHLIGLCKKASQKMIHILKNVGFIELGRFRGGGRETLMFLDKSGAADEVQNKLRMSGSLT